MIDTEREISVRNAIQYCIENFDSQTATNRIFEFWKDELKFQEQRFNTISSIKKGSDDLIGNIKN